MCPIIHTGTVRVNKPGTDFCNLYNEILQSGLLF